MPVIPENSIPIPSLKLYVSLSVLALSAEVYYVINKSNFLDWRYTFLAGDMDNIDENILHQRTDADILGDIAKDNSLDNYTSEKAFQNIIKSYKGPMFLLLSHATNYTLDRLHIERSIMEHHFLAKTTDVINIMFQDTLGALVLINTAFCCSLLFARLLQYLVFGELRVSEKQHLREKFWDYIFYKVVFVVGILGVQTLDEAVPYIAWFSTLCFLLLVGKLCKERFEYLAFSPTTPKWSLTRLGILMLCVLGISLFCVGSTIFIAFIQPNFRLGELLYLLGDSLYVTIYSLFVIVRYGIHTYDMRSQTVWENRATFTYYTDLIFELTLLIVDFLHNVHMFWGNGFLCMPNVICGMKLHNLYYEIKRRLKKHRNYLQVVQLMESNFSMALQEDLSSNSDDCAICWDKMDSARKLPCGHLFHNSCLRSWLEQDTSCPTCRTSLKSTPEEHDTINSQESDEEPIEIQNEPPGVVPNFQTMPNRNHFFHFDSSRYTNYPFLSWLPNISVEAIWRPTLVDMETNQHQNRDLFSPVTLDRLSRNVQEAFPGIPLSRIAEDLMATRSLELTVDNYLGLQAEGRLPTEPSTSDAEDLPKVRFTKNSRSNAILASARAYNKHILVPECETVY